VRNTEPMEKPEITDMHKLFVDPDRHTEVGGPPTGNVPKLAPGNSVQLPAVKPPKPAGVRLGVGIAASVAVVAAGMAVWALFLRDPGKPELVATADAAVAPVETTGTLELDSIPSHAAITLDGRELGIGPQHTTVPANKKIHLQWQLHGYLVFDDEVTAEAGKTAIVRPKLIVAPASARIVTTPATAQVFLHDQLLGNTPITAQGLTAEKQAELTFVKPGYETAKVKVDLVAGDTAEVNQVLKETQKFGYVTIALSGKTPWADVVFNGRDMGHNRNASELLPIKLPVGHQRLLLTNGPAGKSRKLDVDVIADTTRTITTTLD
jgi:hypothetical protein